MKKSIKTILTALAIAMLFISCNADLDQKGIFESMMTSAPNADYTIQRFAGMLGDRFVIETNTGIETLTTGGVKTTLLKGLQATVRFIDDENNRLYYAVQVPGETNNTLRYAAIPTEEGAEIVDYKEASVKYGDEELYIVASFYEDDGEYYLLMQNKDRFYYIAVASKGTLTESDTGNVFSFTDENIHKCAVKQKEVEKDGKKIMVDIVPQTTTYIGEGYYAVTYDSVKHDWYLYNIDGTEVKSKEDSKTFSSRPMAVEKIGDKTYLFLQSKDGNNLYTIEGSEVKPVMTADGKNPVKHTIAYLQLNQDIPMTEHGNKIYGCFGAKPFTFDGTTYADHESIGSGVAIIDMIHHTDGRFYAFSAENGLYYSDDGQKYYRVEK